MNINEIARLAGVSRATVSRYLNNGYVSSEKKEVIRRVIQETGYQPSSQAQTLRTKKTSLIGVILPKINSDTISREVEGISDILTRRGYQLILANTNNDVEEELKYLSLFKERQVDGVVLIATMFTRKHKQMLKDYKVPIVILGQHLDGYPCIYQDDHKAAFQVTEKLSEKGKKFAYIGVTDKDEAVGACRKKGFMDAIHKAKLEVVPERMKIGNFTMDSGYEMAKELFEEEPSIDSLVCATDTMAVGAMTYLKGMDSLKIVLLADIHFGYSIGEKHAGLLVKKINAEDPDLICIAGDIFDNEYEGIKNPKKTAAILRSLKSRYGVYACWGNHDLSEPILAGFTFRNAKKDYDDPRMRNFLESANIRLLDDETVLIDKRFSLTGRKDPSRCRKMSDTRKDPDELTACLDKTLPIIFMDHQPGQLDEVAAAGADLDLCGHTHDGQLFPLNIITGLIWENSCGYLKKGTMHNIVTSGAGIWGPNMRTATNSEICSITVHFYPARPNSSDSS